MADLKFLDPIPCPVCGKPYIKPKSSIFKVRVCGKQVECCSWSCFEKLRKEVKDGKK